MRNRIFIWLLCLMPCSALGQVAGIDSFLTMYPEDYGVFTKQYHRIEFYFDDGALKAKQEVVKEVLPLKESHFSRFSTESVMHHYFSELKSLEAYTLIPKGKSFQKVEMKNIKEKSASSESVFYDDNKETEVAFTNIVLGNRTQMNYTLHHRDAHLMPRFFLQNYLPVHHLLIEVVYPKGMNLDVQTLGIAPSWIRTSKKATKHMITETIEAHRVPKFRIYNSSAPITSYVPHIALLVRSYTDPKTQETKPYISNTRDLNTYLYNFIKDVNTSISPELKQETLKITEGLNTKSAKAEKIFNWVQQHIRYVAFEDSLGGFIPRQASLVYSRKFGDCKDMSSILQAMCEVVDIPAHLTWIGTRDIPYTLDKMPVPSAFNHMICAIKLEDKWLFLDATDNTTPFGAFPHSLQHKEAFINLGPEKFEIVQLPAIDMQENVQYDTTYLSIEAQQLKGKVAIKFHGYPSWEMITKLKYSNKNNIDKTFESILYRGNNKFKLENYNHYIGDNNAKEMFVNADISLSDYMHKVGDDYYVNMHLIKYFTSAKIDGKEMEVPIYNDYKKKIVQVVQLEIPKGYHASYLPSNISYSVPGVASVHVEYKQAGQLVTMSNTIELDYIKVNTDQFENFNKLVDVMQKAYKESIEISLKK